MNRTTSPRSQALLGSDVATPTDALAANPATDSVRNVAMMYAPAPLAIEGAWSGAVGVAYALDDLNRLGAALAANVLLDIYSDQTAALQYARAIPLKDSSRSIVGGLRIRYRSEQFGSRYLPLNQLSADVGLCFDVLERLSAGIAIADLATLYRSQDAASERREAFAGMTWKALDEVRLHAAIEAPQGDAATLRVGIECDLDPHIAARFGAETAMGELAAGVGVHYADISLDMAIVRHPVLGSTLSFALTYGL